MARQRLRFAFKITEGPNAGLGCGGWRVWTHGEDTYVTSTSFGDKLKVSLHGEEAWQVAYTTEHARGTGSLVPAGMGRVVWTFDPTPFEEGRRRAFAVGVTRGSLRPIDDTRKADDDTIVVEDRWDMITVAQIWITEPEVALPDGVPSLAGPLPLRSGRRVWVTPLWEETSPQDPEPIPDSALVQFIRPEEVDVPCPGFIVVGANLG